jgi:hypothetical protein
MKNLRDRRRWPRKILSAPEVCFLDIDTAKRGTEYHLDEFRSSLYVDICEVSPGGVRIKSEEKIECAGLLYLNIYCSSEKLWKCCQGGIKWVQKDSPEHGAYHIGVEVRQSNSEIKAAGHGDKRFKITPLPTDYEFFKGTKFFRSVPRTALCTLLNSLGHIRLKRGERLMGQGETGDSFFIIQSGPSLDRSPSACG